MRITPRPQGKQRVIAHFNNNKKTFKKKDF